MISALIIVLSISFVTALKKINTLVNENFKNAFNQNEVINSANKGFSSTIIILKSLISAEDDKDLKKYTDDYKKQIKQVDVQVDQNLKKYLSSADSSKIRVFKKQLKSEADNLIKLKELDINLRKKVKKTFEEMDLIYRQNKGFVTVVKNLIKDQSLADNEHLLDMIFEDALEVKIYTNQLIGSDDFEDLEDAYLSLLSYTNALITKAKALQQGKKYHSVHTVKLNNKAAANILGKLLDKNESAKSQIESIYADSVKLLETKKNLFKSVHDTEAIVNSIVKEFNTLVDVSSKNMVKGFNDIGSLSKKTYIVTLVLIIVAIGLSLVIGTFTSTKISSPLTKIIAVSNSIRDGNLTVEDIKYDSGDEFEDLTHSVNDMKVSLTGLVTNIKSLSGVLTQNSQNSHSLMENMYQKIAVNNEELAHTASAAEELAVSTNEIAMNVNQGISEVQDAKFQVISGNNKLQDSISRVNNISENLSGVADNLDELNEASNDINNVIKIIVDIAEQTNLLALNAAIEAARAGEAGRGFAVVADEVRKLAEKTSQSTQEISSMVGKIQTNITDVVKTVHHGIEDVESGSVQISEVGHDFQEVVAQMERATSSVEPIINIMEQQNDAIASISSTVNSLSASSEDTKVALGDINDMSLKLEELANDLSSNVSKFRV